MTLPRRLLAESIGSMLLAATVIGSGVMAERLAGGNAAIALLANTAATVALLATLIAVLGPVSGAHFNPAVSLVQMFRGELSGRDALGYVIVQIIGCIVGAFLAHAMFDLSILQTSTHARTGAAQWLSEIVATGGLVLVIVSCVDAPTSAWRVAAWIGAAYWFTASTSFANPAITLARALSNTFSGIRPADAPAFIGAQLVGALLGLYVAKLLFTSASHGARTTPSSEARGDRL